MKKLMKIVPILGLIIIIVSVLQLNTGASPATSYTWTHNSKYDLVRTQDAYLPHRTLTDLHLLNPEDLFFDKDDQLYIADKGNKRIIKYDPNRDQVVMTIELNEFSTPTGLYVTDNGDIYVADTAARAVFKISKDGELLETFSRPTSPAYGDKDYSPSKVAVDQAGNMYIISEGVYDGVIQLTNSGEFVGFFTSNKVTLTWVQRLQDIFFTDAQKANLLGRTPSTFSNVFVDEASIVYTTSMGNMTETVKKHNTAGQNMLQEIFDNGDTTDIYVDANGIIFTATKAGLIFVFSNDGEFIYLFGAYNPNQDISGLYSSLSSIAVDSKGNLWTVDGEKSFLQSFVPTDFANMIYEAIATFNNGMYDEAIKIWNEVIRFNQMSVLAHNNIGKNYLYQQDYERAMYHTEVAGNRYFYSQAYWEVRNIWLQNNLTGIMIGLITIIAITKILKVLDKKKGILTGPKKVIKQVFNIKPIRDTLFIFKFFRHPIDSFYDLKKGIKGSYLGATIILIGFFVTYIWSTVGRGFIYQFLEVEDIDFNSITLGFFAIIILFIVCNYLVSSIKDGEGSLGELYKMLMYSFGPILVALVVVTIASHFLTQNEAFLLTITMQIGYVWTAVNIVLGVQETHSYDTRVALKSIFITFMFMIIIAVLLLIIIILGEQVILFFDAIIKEGIRNVIS